MVTDLWCLLLYNLAIAEFKNKDNSFKHNFMVISSRFLVEAIDRP
jgi:hypothetical protein